MHSQEKTGELAETAIQNEGGRNSIQCQEEAGRKETEKGISKNGHSQHLTFPHPDGFVAGEEKKQLVKNKRSSLKVTPRTCQKN